MIIKTEILHNPATNFKKIKFTDAGFTKIELIVITVVIVVIIALLKSIYGHNDPEKSHEAELKSNIHSIQMAIERYAVDYGSFPAFLLGGDLDGWTNWHKMYDEKNPPPNLPSNNLVQDVLIQYGYIASYPRNPFVDDGMTVIQTTAVKGHGANGELIPGDGDPRFGFDGDVMGNGLDDPDFYRHRIIGIPPEEYPLIETRRTLSDDTVKELGFCEPPKGLHYMMGGRKAIDENGKVLTVATWWPGNFFYRSFEEYQLPREGWAWYDPGFIPFTERKRPHYILGGYGELNATGFDVIRLESKSYDNTDDIYFRLPAPWYKFARGSGIKCGYDLSGTEPVKLGSGLPCVSGGGDAFTGPFYPPNRDDGEDGYEYGEYIYGASDGHPDGVIIVITDSGINLSIPEKRHGFNLVRVFTKSGTVHNPG